MLRKKMTKPQVVPKVIQKIEKLAHETLLDEEKYDLLHDEIQKLVDKGKVKLETLIGYMIENTDNVDALIVVKEICEDITAALHIFTSPQDVYQATLVIMPILYSQPADFNITELNNKSANFKKLTKNFYTSGMMSKESAFYLDKHLYHPSELLNLSYDEVYAMTKQMVDNLTGQPGNNFSIEISPIERPENGNDTFMLKYLVGMKITHESLIEAENNNVNDEAFEKFVDSSQPLLEKMLGVEGLTVLSLESYYEGLQFGLDTFLSEARKIRIEQELSFNDIHPHGVKAIITISRESANDSSIELVSKLTAESFANFNFEVINCNDPEALLDAIAGDLEECGFKTEDIYLNIEGDIVPFVSLLKPQTEAEKELNDFDVEFNPTNNFVVSTGKKPTLH